jgi:aryl-alcohol dehydrogenase-like predicted oxidoreductase
MILGTWLNFMPDASSLKEHRQIIGTALDSGVTEIDTSNNYGFGLVEGRLGKLLSNYSRDKFRISTKVYSSMREKAAPEGLSRASIMRNVESSLRRLSVGHIDTYICHRYDPAVTLDEVSTTMNDLIRSGKIRKWGVSHWTPKQLQECALLCRNANIAPPESNQIQYNLLSRSLFEGDLCLTLKALKIEAHAFSPLACGYLTGKYNTNSSPGRLDKPGNSWLKRRLDTPKNRLKMERFIDLSNLIGLSPAQMALRWIFNSAAHAVVIGPASVAQFEMILKEYLGDLDEDVKLAIERIFD